MASLRPVDDLKNVLLPLNLPHAFQMIFGLGHSLSALHEKVDQVIALSRCIPGAQETQLDILQRLSHVDALSTSQEQAGKASRELMKKVEDNISSLQAEASTNSEALSAIRKEVEARAEVERLAAWRNSHSVEQSTQTVVPVAYVNSQVGTESPLTMLNANAPKSSPNVVDAQLLAFSPPSAPQPPDGCSNFLTQQSTTLQESAVTLDPTPPPPKRAPAKKGPAKLKRRTAKTRASPSAPAMENPPETAPSETVPPANDSPVDVFGPVSQVPPPPVASTSVPKSKKRKHRDTTDSSDSSPQRRSARPRKIVLRFGQESLTESEAKNYAAEKGVAAGETSSTNEGVLVPGTQQAANQPPSRKRAASKAASKAPSPSSLIYLPRDTLDSLNSIESSNPLQPNLAVAGPSSQPNHVPETQFTFLEPIHITRCATRSLEGRTRQAIFTGDQERVDMGDPLREAIDEDDYGEYVTGSQLLGFEPE